MGIGKSLTKIVAPIVMASALAFGVPKNANAETPIPKTFLPPNIETAPVEDNSYIPIVGISDIYGLYSFQMNFDFYQNPTFRIQSIPEYIRNVPAHPNEGGEQLPPIKDIGKADFTELKLVEGKLGIGINDKKRFELSTGINLGLDPSAAGRVFNERNYTNAPGTNLRGYGAALTYYKIYSKPVLSIGPFVRGNLYNVLFLDYSADFSNIGIVVENGWDRWDKLELKDTYDANFEILNHKFGISVDALSLGVAINRSIEHKENIFSLLSSREIYTPFSLKLSFNTKIPQVLYKSSLAQEMELTLLRNSSVSIIFETKGMKDFVKIKKE